ncbi:hypothetical protein V3F56_03370 [Moorellaceae bacterium AZ2]
MDQGSKIFGQDYAGITQCSQFFQGNLDTFYMRRLGIGAGKWFAQWEGYVGIGIAAMARVNLEGHQQAGLL